MQVDQQKIKFRTPTETSGFNLKVLTLLCLLYVCSIKPQTTLKFHLRHNVLHVQFKRFFFFPFLHSLSSTTASKNQQCINQNLTLIFCLMSLFFASENIMMPAVWLKLYTQKLTLLNYLPCLAFIDWLKKLYFDNNDASLFLCFNFAQNQMKNRVWCESTCSSLFAFVQTTFLMHRKHHEWSKKQKQERGIECKNRVVHDNDQTEYQHQHQNS